ncbi:hypothetical protein K474DRAFT_1208799 [Panus rudis PR-1116 ss-1]|nr:hypothetical protein K474DRAFT_1208799 [Panus rudis PR-1116 ss-1]
MWRRPFVQFLLFGTVSHSSTLPATARQWKPPPSRYKYLTSSPQTSSSLLTSYHHLPPSFPLPSHLGSTTPPTIQARFACSCSYWSSTHPNWALSWHWHGLRSPSMRCAAPVLTMSRVQHQPLQHQVFNAANFVSGA